MIKSRSSDQQAFTLMELVLVIAIIAIISTILTARTGSFAYWKQEAFVRRITETIEFLHHQAITDQAFYQMEFDFKTSSYRVGVLRPEDDIDERLIDYATDAGHLSLELAAFLSPTMGETQTMIPPPSFPSLAEPVQFLPGTYLKNIRTMRGLKEEGRAYIRFSPRGFSEFAVLHLSMLNKQPLTILVNPFTGLTEIYREFKDFEWTYGRQRS